MCFCHFGEIVVTGKLGGISQLFSMGKQMLLSPVAPCREQGAASGVYGKDVRAKQKTSSCSVKVKRL